MNALEVFSSFEKAAELAKEPNSGCTLVSTEQHIALSPKYIGRLRTGVGEILDAELGRFSESLRGVLLAYGNVKLLQSSGAIVDDSPFIHFDVKLDAVVFKPKIGSLLKCVVNEQASDHVGCLVHDWFNVSLLASRKELNGQRRPRLEPGYVVLVQVQRLRALNGMLAIEARAPDDRSDLILEAVSLQGKDTDSESNVDSFPQPSASDTPDGPGISTVMPGVEATSEKKKRKRSLMKQELDVDSHQPSVSDSPDGPGISTVTSGLETSSEKKKKRKHSKVKQELDVDSHQPSVSDTPGAPGISTVTSGLETSSVKKKKRKHSKVKQELDVDSNQPSVSDGPGISTVTSGLETSSKKKKKRKHSKVKQELDVDSNQPSVSDTPDGPGISTVTSGLETSSKKKKKKKRSKVKQELDVDSNQPSVSDFPDGPGISTVTSGLETSSETKKKKKNSKVKQELDLDSNQPSVSDTPGISTVTSGLETSSEKKKKRKHSKVKQELSEDSKQLSPCLEAPISLEQTDEETSGPKKSKKHKRIKTTVESNGHCTPNGAAEGTTGAETSNKKKKQKRKHIKTEAVDSESSACNSGNDLAQITAGEETSPKRKKKKKGRETRPDLDSHQPPDILSGPTTIELEKADMSRGQTAKGESPAEHVVSDNQPLFSELPSSDKSFTKLKKKKHGDKENGTATDSSHQPLFSADPSSVMEGTIPKKLKKHKKAGKLETDECVTPHSSGNFETSKIKKEPGEEFGCFRQSALTPGPEVRNPTKNTRERGRSMKRLRTR